MIAWEHSIVTTTIRLTFHELWTAKVKEGATGWDLIEQHGRDGWELVSTIPLASSDGGTVAIAWVFKRPLVPVLQPGDETC